MSKFHFSFCVRPDPASFFYQHVELEEVPDGIEISCDSPDSECVHFLHPAQFDSFVEAIGQAEGLGVMDAAKLAVKRNKRPLVYEAVHALAETKFTWYDWDSPFYGDKGVEVMGAPKFDPPKKLFFGMLGEYESLSEEDKARFVSDLAKQFFPDETN